MSFEEKLIEIVKKSPYLYNKNHPYYKKNKKNRKWREIAEKLQVDENKCRLRWGNLRDQFTREIRKLESPINSAVGKPRWKYFEMLKFLCDVTHQKKIPKNNSALKNECYPTSPTCSPAEESIGEKEAVFNMSSVFSENSAFLSSRNVSNLNKKHQSTQSDPSTFAGSRPLPAKIRPCQCESEITMVINELRSQIKEDEINTFFLSAAHLCRSASFTQVELIDLEVEILNVIKLKIKQKG